MHEKACGSFHISEMSLKAICIVSHPCSGQERTLSLSFQKEILLPYCIVVHDVYSAAVNLDCV